jgi:DNA-binding response OmpR family regulator
MAKKRILLIEDEADLGRVTTMNLERTGEFQVTTAPSGEAGLALAHAQPFDLVITDFNLPGLDGGRVALALKAQQPRCPVVLFSVYHDDETSVTPEIRQAVDGLLSKPLDHGALMATIHRLLP